MRFELEPEVFTDEPAVQDHLDRLLARVVDEVHYVVVLDAAAMQRSRWFNEARPHVREFVRSAVQAAAFLPPGKAIRVGSDLPLPSAARLAYIPLTIAVENQAFDGLLVEVAIRSFGNADTIRLWESDSLTGKAMRLAHGGGTGDLKKEIVRTTNAAKSSSLPARLVVLTDSDSRWMGEIRKSRVEVEAACAPNSVPCVVLTCRAAENYIPDAALRRWADQPGNESARDQVDALLRLSDEQRDHIRMKGDHAGLRELAIPRNPPPRQQVDLFSKVPRSDRSLLVGFPKHIIERLREYILQPNAVELSARDRHGDLPKLVSIIEASL